MCIADDSSKVKGVKAVFIRVSSTVNIQSRARLTYHTPNKPTWLPVAHRLGLGLYAVQPPLSFGERPPQNIHTGGPFHTPPTNHGGGTKPFPIPTSHHLPIPYLGTQKAYGWYHSTDPPPRGPQCPILPHPYPTHTIKQIAYGSHPPTLTKYLLQVESQNSKMGN